MACQKNFGARAQKCKASFTGSVIEDFVATSSYEIRHNKDFVKAMDRNVTAFLYLRQKFSLLSGAKI